MTSKLIWFRCRDSLVVVWVVNGKYQDAFLVGYN